MKNNIIIAIPIFIDIVKHFFEITITKWLFFFQKKCLTISMKIKITMIILFFHLIRSAQYLPNEYRGKLYFEMTDLISVNYKQIIKNTSLLNPVKYLYLFEYTLLKSYRKKYQTFLIKLLYYQKRT